MDRIQRIRAYLRKVFGYSAARWSPDRTMIQAPLRDARLDLQTATREKLVALSRHWERESGFYQKKIDLWELYVAGPEGLASVATSSVPDWNTVSDEEFDAWSLIPDLQSRQSFSTFTGLVGRTWFVDGECFVRKTFGESRRPRIQMIEGHSVKTPDDLKEQEGISVVDGVAIDANGRPTGYWVKVRDGFTLIPADQIIHVFEPQRPGQYRGIPIAASVLNDIHDLEDLQKFEMLAAKNASAISNVIQKKSGEISRSGLTRQRFQIGQTSNAGGAITETKIAHIETKLPGSTIAIGSDEELKQFQSNRPSVASQQFWDHILEKICSGTGISRLLVLPRSIQGTVMRADLDTQDAFFRARSAVLQGFVREVRNYVIRQTFNFSPRLRNIPGDWQSVAVHPPRSVRVDVGYDSAATINEIKAGLGTRRDFWLARGKNWRTETRQIAIEIAEIKALAVEFNLDPAEIDEHLATNAQAQDTQSV